MGFGLGGYDTARGEKTMKIHVLAALSCVAAIGVLGLTYDSPPELPLSARIDMGKISGWSQVHKFGHNPTVTTTEDIWDCPDLNAAGNVTYPFPDAAVSLYVTSNDEADAGLEVTIVGLDANWNEQTVAVDLGADAGSGGTAAAAVGTADNWMRVFRAYNTESAGTAYAGDIYIHTDDDPSGDDGEPDLPLTQLLACISAGHGQTEMAIYTIPNGYTGLLMASGVALLPAAVGATRSTDATFLSRENGRAWRVRDRFGAQENGMGINHRKFSVLRSFPEKTDLRWRSEAPSASSSLSATFDLWLVPGGMGE